MLGPSVRVHKTKRKSINTKAALTMRCRGIVDAIAAAGTYAITNYVDLGASILILWYGECCNGGAGEVKCGALISFQLYWDD